MICCFFILVFNLLYRSVFFLKKLLTAKTVVFYCYFYIYFGSLLCKIDFLMDVTFLT